MKSSRPSVTGHRNLNGPKPELKPSGSKDFFSRSLASVPEPERKLNRSFVNNNDLMKKYLNRTSANSDATQRKSSKSDIKGIQTDLPEESSFLESKNHDNVERLDSSKSFIFELARTKSKKNDKCENQFNSSWNCSDSDSSCPSFGDNDKPSVQTNSKNRTSVDRGYAEKSIFDIHSKDIKNDDIDFSITLDLDSDDDGVDGIPDQLRSEPTRMKSPINLDMAPEISLVKTHTDKSPIPTLANTELTDSDSSIICSQRPNSLSFQNFRDWCSKVPLADYESDGDSSSQTSKSNKSNFQKQIKRKSDTKGSDNDCFISDRPCITPASHSEDDFFITNRNKIQVESNNKSKELNISKHKKSVENPVKCQAGKEKSSFLRADAFISKFTSRSDNQVEREAVGLKPPEVDVSPMQSSNRIHSINIQSQQSAFQTVHKPTAVSPNQKLLASKTNQTKFSGIIKNSSNLNNTPQQSNFQTTNELRYSSQLDTFQQPKKNSNTNYKKSESKQFSPQISNLDVSNVVSKSTEDLLKILDDHSNIKESPTMAIQMRKHSVSPAITMEDSFSDTVRSNIAETKNSVMSTKIVMPETKNNLFPHLQNNIVKRSEQKEAVINPVVQMAETSSKTKPVLTSQKVSTESLFRPISRIETPNYLKNMANASLVRSTDASSKMELEQIFVNSQRNSKSDLFGSLKRAQTPYAERGSGQFIEKCVKVIKEPVVDGERVSDKSMELSVTLVEETSSSLSISNRNDEINDNNLEVASRRTVSSSSSSSDSSCFLSPLTSSQRSTQKLNFTRLAYTDANNNTLEGKKGLIKNCSPSILCVSKPSRTYYRKPVRRPNHHWFIKTMNSYNEDKTSNINIPIKKKKLFHLQSNYIDSCSSTDSFRKNTKQNTTKSKAYIMQKGLFDIAELNESSGEEYQVSEKIKKNMNTEHNLNEKSSEKFSNNVRRSTRPKQKIIYKESSYSGTDKGASDISCILNEKKNCNNIEQNQKMSLSTNTRVSGTNIKNLHQGKNKNNKIKPQSKSSTKEHSEHVFDFLDSDMEITSSVSNHKIKNKTDNSKVQRKVFKDTSNMKKIRSGDKKNVELLNTVDRRSKRQEISIPTPSFENRVKRPKIEKLKGDLIVVSNPSSCLSTSLTMSSIQVQGTVHHADNYEPSLVTEVPTNQENSSLSNKINLCDKIQNNISKTSENIRSRSSDAKVQRKLENCSNAKYDQSEPVRGVKVGNLETGLKVKSKNSKIKAKCKPQEGKLRENAKIYETRSKAKKMLKNKSMSQEEMAETVSNKQDNLKTDSIVQVESSSTEIQLVVNEENDSGMLTDNFDADINVPLVNAMEKNTNIPSLPPNLSDHLDSLLINSLETIGSNINDVLQLLQHINVKCKQHQELVQELKKVVQTKEKSGN